MADQILTLLPNTGDPLAINEGPIRLDRTGGPDVDWGDMAVEVELAQGPDVDGAVPMTRRRPIREVVLGLHINTTTPTAYVEASSALHRAVAELQREGGFVRRQVEFAGGSASESLDLEVISADLTGPEDSWTEERRFGQFVLTLTCQPEWLGVEEEKADVTTTVGEIVHGLVLDSGGDGTAPGGVIPGPGKVEITDLTPARRRFAELGYERNPDPNAAILFGADEFELGEPATLESETIGQAIEVTPLAPYWQTMGILRDLPHRRTWQVRGRAQFSAESSATASLRLSYREGGGVWVELEPVTVRSSDPAAYHEVDLGSIHLRPDASDTVDIRVEVRTSQFETTVPVRLNWLTAFPASEWYAIARAVPVIRAAKGLITFDDSPATGESSVALNGRTSPSGHTWATTGDTSPAWNYLRQFGWVQRSGAADTNAQSGGFALLDTGTYAATRVAGVIRTQQPFSLLGFNFCGVIARYVNTSNWLAAGVQQIKLSTGNAVRRVVVYRVIGGTLTTIGVVNENDVPGWTNFAGDGAHVQLTVQEDGRWTLDVGRHAYKQFTPTKRLAEGQDNALATGGTLASGRTGIYHAATEANRFGLVEAFQTHEDAPLVQNTDIVREDGAGVFDHRRSYASGGPNLLANPDFEANTVGWEPSGSAEVVIARTTDEAHSGDAALQVDVPADTSPGVGAKVSGTAGDAFGLTAANPLVGRDYVFSAWVLAPVGLDMALRVDPGDGGVEEPFVGTGAWRYVEFPFTFVGPFLEILAIYADTDGGPSETFYVDDARFALVDLIQPHPIYQGRRVTLPPGPGRLAIKLRHGDSDAEPDALSEDDQVRIRVFHRPAYSSLSDALE